MDSSYSCSGDCNGFLILLFLIVVPFVFIGIPAIVIATLASQASRFGHKKSLEMAGVSIAQYDPPENLSPAELGYLIDSRISKPELIGTLFDLEQRGFLTISSGGLEGLKVERLPGMADITLRAHETFVLDELSGNTPLAIFLITKMSGFKKAVLGSLREHNLVKSPSEVVKYYVRRSTIAYAGISIFIMLPSLGSGRNIFDIIGSFILLSIFLLPMLVVSTFIVAKIYDNIVGQPGLWTEKLKTLWPEIQGFREYVRQVDLDEIQFESSKLKMVSKNKNLPYAIALGLNTEWESRFK